MAAAKPARFELSPQQLDRTLNDIDQIGNRFHGTPGEARCRDYLLERFKDMGLHSVRLEKFDYLACEPRTASCRVEGMELPCRGIQFSASAEAEGKAVYVGTGSAEDFDRLDGLGVDLSGKIVVAHSNAPFMLAPYLDGRGIAGLVNIGQTPDGLIGHFANVLHPAPLEPPWEGRPVAYPSVTVEAAKGRELLSTMTGKPSVTVRVEHRADYAVKQAANVVGEIPGAGRERVVIGGHYDSQAEGPCIWDNATGIAGVLDIARVLAQHDLRRTVVVAAFAIEEIGLYGSRWYTIHHAAELRDTVGMVNLDAVSSVYPAKRALWTDSAMRDFAVQCATEQGWDIETIFSADRFQPSDNQPFTDAGVPACWIREFPPPNPFYHSAGDVRALIDTAKLAAAAAVAGRIVHRLALGEQAPTRRIAAKT